jgi:hypothetical protein
VERNRRDLAGEWFAALEELGESFLFRLGRFRAGMAEPEWFFLPHQDYDGIGGLAHVLRSEGSDIDVPRMTEKPPSWWGLLLAFLRLFFRRKARPMRWRGIDDGWKSTRPEDAAPTALAWTLFSKQDTLRLRDVARARGVSLNAWMLWALKEAVLPHLVPGSGDIEWVVPVNMRGVVQADRDTANQATAIEVTFAADADPHQVHASIRRELARGLHWLAARLMGMMARWLDPKAVRRAAQREAQVPKQGSFSNMGLLGPSRSADGTEDRDEWWMAFNPVLKARPVGVACLTWRGRLAVTLQLHPALSRDLAEARAWLNAWRDRALPPEDAARAPNATAAGAEALEPPKATG